MDYCPILWTFEECLPRGIGENPCLQAKTLTGIMRQAWRPQSKMDLWSPLNEPNLDKVPLFSRIV